MSMKKALPFALVSLAAIPMLVAQSPVAPTVDQILSLKRVGVAGNLARRPLGRLHGSRDELGRQRVRNRDLARRRSRVTGRTRATQLTNAKKSSQSPAWSPDGSRLAFISDRTDKRQIYVINPQAGEAEAVTTLEDGVGAASPGRPTARASPTRRRNRSPRSSRTARRSTASSRSSSRTTG